MIFFCTVFRCLLKGAFWVFFRLFGSLNIHIYIHAHTTTCVVRACVSLVLLGSAGLSTPSTGSTSNKPLPEGAATR